MNPYAIFCAAFSFLDGECRKVDACGKTFSARRSGDEVVYDITPDTSIRVNIGDRGRSFPVWGYNAFGVPVELFNGDDLEAFVCAF